MDMQSLLSEGCRILEEASKVIQEAAAQLSPPEIHPLNYRVATQICAAVAVDAGQNLFKGALQLSFRGNVCSTHIWGNRVYLPPHLVV